MASTRFQDDLPIDGYEDRIGSIVNDLFAQWEGFEDYVQSIDVNRWRYFKEKRDATTNEIRVNANWQGYYKGVTLNNDLRAYFVDRSED